MMQAMANALRRTYARPTRARSRISAIVAELTAPLRDEIAELRRLIETRPTPATPDDLLTVAEAAQLRGCTVAAMRKQVQRGTVSSVPHGRRGVRVRRGSL